MSEESMFEAAYSKAVDSGWDSVKDLARQMWDEARTQLASTGGEVPYQWPTFEEWLEYELDGSGIDPDSIKGDTRLYASRAYFCAGHMHNRIVAAMQPGPAGPGVPHETLNALLEHCDTIEKSGESFTEIKPETLRALCSALLNQAGGE